MQMIPKIDLVTADASGPRNARKASANGGEIVDVLEDSPRQDKVDGAAWDGCHGLG
jgi:hypothetical protein